MFYDKSKYSFLVLLLYVLYLLICYFVRFQCVYSAIFSFSLCELLSLKLHLLLKFLLFKLALNLIRHVEQN